MSDDWDEDAGKDIATQVQGEEIPIWPNLPDVPLEQRCRAWCLATALDAIPFNSKPADFAKAAVAVAGIFEDYITAGRQAPKLAAVKE